MIWQFLTTLLVLSATPTLSFTTAPTGTSPTVDTSAVIAPNPESSPSQSTDSPSTASSTATEQSTIQTVPITSITEKIITVFTPSTSEPTSTTTTAPGTTELPFEWNVTAPPSVVSKWCMIKLQKNNAQFTIDFIENAEEPYEEAVEETLCVQLNRKSFETRLEDLTNYCGQRESDAFKEYVANRRKIHHCDQYL
ncbi:DUF281 domain-containing protein [Caenorhabditis elegans]|uniref:DUF281 domain-containing protein n=1 Tax=Caenorhabditis elegans TaxID=6239 RepID=B1Q273_CAEEL|nr:DUF281 domain-containing protein [Caenorhabditis elegans]CAQ16175.1 DUF281 domain-containing protein [Caenorhabditis elegans]|eukprot:NP_001122895.1 Uncharacterized protein CELE_D1086.10 [Caenorhabditis elegans]